MQDDEGNFVLKKDGTPRKKGGRPNTAEQAKLAAQRTVARKQKNIHKLEEKLKIAKKSFKKQKTTLENLGSGDQTLVTDSDISALHENIIKIIEEKFNTKLR